ncbi:MAG: energy-coupling factor transporter ATPase [Chloroflexota bacterium]
MKPLICIENLTFVHPAARPQDLPALRSLSLSIAEGELVALIGANGSGKTTLARHLNAVLLPTQGRVLVNGLDTRDPANHAEIRAQVGMVFQYPEDQIVGATVAEDVAFGPENLGLPRPEIQARLDAALLAVGMQAFSQRPAHMLSAGQIQRVAVAGVLAMKPRCIVFDETTSMLDPAGREMVMDTMLALHREGLTILFITHSMEEAARAQRVIVMDEGQIVMDAAPPEVFSQGEKLQALKLELPQAASFAQKLRPHFPQLAASILTLDELVEAILLCRPIIGTPAPEKITPATVRVARSLIIEVSHLGYIYQRGTPLAFPSLEDVSLRVAEGQAYALIGATGSGKSTLFQHLNALLRPQRGHLRVAGYDLEDAGLDRRALRRKVALAFQTPENYFFEQYVGDEISYGPRQLAEQSKSRDKSALRNQVRIAMELIGLDFEQYKDRLTYTLSGGERRKVALASVLAVNPQILVLDEPGAGLDPASRRALMSRLSLLKEGGMTVLIASHNMEELANWADALTVLHNGRDVLSGSAQQVFSQNSHLQELGLEAPFAVRLAERLRSAGLPLPPEGMDMEALLAIFTS